MLKLNADPEVFCQGGRWENRGDYYIMEDDFGEFVMVNRDTRVVTHRGFTGYLMSNSDVFVLC